MAVLGHHTLGFSRKLKNKVKKSLRAKIFASGKPALDLALKKSGCIGQRFCVIQSFISIHVAFQIL